MTSRLQRSILLLVSSCVALLGSTLIDARAFARQDEASDLESELAELGATLKAAVMSGAMDGSEARDVYRAMAATIKAEAQVGNSRLTEQPKQDGDWKDAVSRLVVPNPFRVEALLRPAFLERDLQLLREELELDQFQAEIAEALIDNYLEAFELITVPYREGYSRYQQGRRDLYVSNVLSRVNSMEVDEVVDRTRSRMQDLRRESVAEVLAKGGDDDASRERARQTEEKWSAWEEEMVVAAQTMESRLDDIRGRVAQRMADTDQPIGSVELVAIATELRAEAEALRAAFTEQLSAVLQVEADEQRAARFRRAMSRILRERELSRGTMAGERMDLNAVARQAMRRLTGAEAEEARSQLDAVIAMLADREPDFALALEARRQASIDREIEGLRMLIVRDELVGERIGSGTGADWAWLGNATRPYEVSLKAESAAAVRVRDMNLAMLADATALLTESDSDAGARYRTAALQRGFPAEMRKRWAQQALDAAIMFETLDADRFLAVNDLHDAMMQEVGMYREQGVASRIEREPRRMIERIDKQFDNEPSNAGLEEEDFFGPNEERYEQLDERIDAQLKAILLPEEYAMLPPRSEPNAKAWDKQGGAAGKGGRGRSKGGAAKGKGGGVGAGGKGGGAGGKGGGGK